MLRLYLPALCLFSVSAASGVQQAAPRPAPASVSSSLPASLQASLPASVAASPRALMEQRAAAYFHFTQARSWENQAEGLGNGNDLNHALEEYRAAIHADPHAAYLPEQMAELLFRMGQTGDAIRLARSVVEEHPADPAAHHLLGEFYTRLLGDNSNTRPNDVLKLALEQFQAVVRLTPNDSVAHLTLGRLYRAAQQPVAAEQEFRAALARNGASEEAVSNLVLLLADQHKLTAAEAVVAAVPASARTARIYGALGAAEAEYKQFPAAVDAYTKAMALSPDDLDLRRGLAQAYFSGGELKRALAQYREIAQQDPEDWKAELRLSQIYRQLGQFPQAEAALKTAGQLLPDNPEISYYGALLYEGEGKTPEAITALQELLQQTAHPDGKYSEAEATNRGVFLQRMGSLERRLGHFPAAVSAFQQMTSLGGDNTARAFVELTETYRVEHDYARALSTAAAGVSQLPNDHGLRLTYAGLLADSGKVDAGLAQIQGMLQGNAQDRELYLSIGQIQERARHWAEAGQAADQALRLSSSNQERAVAYFLRGGIFEKQKLYDRAESDFRQALQLDPHNALVLNYLGYMLAERGVRLQEALGYVQQALVGEENNGAFLDSLGWVYFKLNRFDEAAASLEKAAELERTDPVVLGHLAAVYLRTGHLREAEVSLTRALNQWQVALPADYDAAEVAKVRQQLEATRTRLARMNGRP